MHWDLFRKRERPEVKGVNLLPKSLKSPEKGGNIGLRI